MDELLSQSEDLNDFDEGQVDLSKFSLEINSSSIPFEYSRKASSSLTETKKEKERTTSISWVSRETKEFFRTQTTVSPIKGDKFPGALAQDVLTVLMTLAVEQKNRQEVGVAESGKVKVWYSLSEICRRLNTSINNNKNIKSAIEELENVNIHYKDFICDDESFKTESIKTRIITRSGRSSRGSHAALGDEKRESFWIEFDGRVAQSLFDGLYGTLSRDIYLKLPSGASRGIYNIICVKRRIEGNRFYIDLDDVAKKIGLKNTKIKSRYSVKQYIKKISLACDNFTFYFANVGGRACAKIIFSDSPEEFEKIGDNSFYTRLLKQYKESDIKSVGLQKHDIEYMLENYSEETTKFKGRKIPSIEFCIDVALNQSIIGGYKVSNIKGLIRKMMSQVDQGGVSLPDTYHNFLDARIEEERDKTIVEEIKNKEIEKKQREERDREYVREMANGIIENIQKDNPRKYERIKSLATDRLKAYMGESYDLDMLKDFGQMVLKEAMEEIVCEKIESGDIEFLGSSKGVSERIDILSKKITRPSIIDTIT